MATLISVNTRNVSSTTYRQVLEDWGVPILNEWQEGPIRIFKVPEGYRFPDPSGYAGAGQAPITPEEQKRQEDLKNQQEFIQSTLQTGGSTRVGYVSDLAAYEQQQNQARQLAENRSKVTVNMIPSSTLAGTQGITKPGYLIPENPQLEVKTPSYQESVTAQMEGRTLKPLEVTGRLLPVFSPPDYETANYGYAPASPSSRYERDIQEFGMAALGTSPVGMAMQGGLGAIGIMGETQKQRPGLGRVSSLFSGIGVSAYGYGTGTASYFTSTIFRQDADLSAAQLIGMFGGGSKAAGKWGYSKLAGKTAKVSYSYGMGASDIFYAEREPVSFGQSSDRFVVGKRKPMAFKAELNAFFLTEQPAAKQFKAFGKSLTTVNEIPKAIYSEKPMAFTVKAASSGTTFDIGKMPETLFRDYQRGKVLVEYGRKKSTGYFKARSGIEKLYGIDFSKPQFRQSFLGEVPIESVVKYNAATKGAMISKYRIPRVYGEIGMISKRVNAGLRRYKAESFQVGISRYNIYRLDKSILKGEIPQAFRKASIPKRDVLYDLKVHHEIDSVIKEMSKLRGVSLKAAEKPIRKIYAKQFYPSNEESLSTLGPIASPFSRRRFYEQETFYSAKAMPGEASMRLEPELRSMSMRIPIVTLDRSSRNIQKQFSRMEQNSRQRMREIQGTESIQNLGSSQKSIQGMRSSQMERQALKQVMVLKITTKTVAPMPFPFRFAPSRPPTKFPSMSLPKYTFKYPNPFKKGRSYKSTYTPSVAGIDLGFKAYKIPTKLTGLEIRPVIVNGRTRFSLRAGKRGKPR